MKRTERTIIDYTPEIGDLVKLDCRFDAARLIECDDFPAEYRLTGWNGDIPVRIEITGRVERFDVRGIRGRAMVRCRVQFADGEGDWSDPVGGFINTY